MAQNMAQFPRCWRRISQGSMGDDRSPLDIRDDHALRLWCRACHHVLAAGEGNPWLSD